MTYIMRHPSNRIHVHDIEVIKWKILAAWLTCRTFQLKPSSWNRSSFVLHVMGLIKKLRSIFTFYCSDAVFRNFRDPFFAVYTRPLRHSLPPTGRKNDLWTWSEDSVQKSVSIGDNVGCVRQEPSACHINITDATIRRVPRECVTVHRTSLLVEGLFWGL